MKKGKVQNVPRVFLPVSEFHLLCSTQRCVINIAQYVYTEVSFRMKRVALKQTKLII